MTLVFTDKRQLRSPDIDSLNEEEDVGIVFTARGGELEAQGRCRLSLASIQDQIYGETLLYWTRISPHRMCCTVVTRTAMHFCAQHKLVCFISTHPLCGLNLTKLRFCAGSFCFPIGSFVLRLSSTCGQPSHWFFHRLYLSGCSWLFHNVHTGNTVQFYTIFCSHFNVIV